jgi:D,D-heptose 1,7-bisphosphate phosphatase
MSYAADRPLPAPRVRQAVVLVGGKGTRLGELTRTTPKPLMPIDEDRVFLDLLLDNLARQGFDRILLLAGHFGEQIQACFDGRVFRGATISVAIEPEPKGTGGALKWSRDRLEERFLLLNGDTYFDIGYRAFEKALNESPEALAALALRAAPDAARYGSVALDNGRVRGFREKAARETATSGLINGGVYLIRREAVDLLPEGSSSLEADLFPALAAKGLLIGARRDGYFIDIGLPDTLSQARSELPAVLRRPALFLDRDGVINVDHGYVHKWKDLDFSPGVAETIAAFNDAGWFVFVVTNQAGVAHGYYDENAVHRLHEQIRDWLAARGAHIDAFYYCPYHPKAAIEAYRADHPDRKPRAGMLSRAIAEWPVVKERSLLIGDRDSDLAAAAAVGVEARLFESGALDAFISAEGFWPIAPDRAPAII